MYKAKSTFKNNGKWVQKDELISGEGLDVKFLIEKGLLEQSGEAPVLQMVEEPEEVEEAQEEFEEEMEEEFEEDESEF